MQVDLELSHKLNRIFNPNTAYISTPIVIAAIITAAAKMAEFSQLVTEDETIAVLLDLYEGQIDDRTIKLIGCLATECVRNNIGYAVDFNNPIKALNAYQNDKDRYDELYQIICERYNKKSNVR